MGFIILDRDMFEDEIWTDIKIKSNFEALVDLIRMANYSEPKIIPLRGRQVIVGRGQLAYSQDTLAKRWGWSRGKVLRYLSVLETGQYIVQQKSKLITLITIVNYDKFKQDGTTLNTTHSTTLDTTVGTTTKKDKKEKTKNISLCLEKTLKERKIEFRNTIIPFKEDYEDSTLIAFYNHWTEKEINKEKMRFEYQQFWEIDKRLASWETNRLKLYPQPDTTYKP